MQSFIDKNRPTNKVDEFIGMCLQSSTYIHSAHFVTKSYSNHKALENFYQNMPALIDTFVEVYIGIGNAYNPTIKTESSFDAVAYLRRIADAGTSIYPNVDSSLKSIIDDIKILCYQTIYRLEHLS